VPYLSVIGALLFLASHTRPDISFSLNLLARYSSCPTRRHWNVVKQIFRYLQGQEAPKIIHEDNAACIAQLKGGYIKGDRTKHILPKFFFTYDLQKSGDIIVQQVHSSDNLADLFTKALPTATFKNLVHDIGMRRLKELKWSNHQRENIHTELFFS
nr:retrotransposon like protein [Tanacetum cinerariifolium]